MRLAELGYPREPTALPCHQKYGNSPSVLELASAVDHIPQNCLTEEEHPSITRSSPPPPPRQKSDLSRSRPWSLRQDVGPTTWSGERIEEEQTWLRPLSHRKVSVEPPSSPPACVASAMQHLSTVRNPSFVVDTQENEAEVAGNTLNEVPLPLHSKGRDSSFGHGTSVSVCDSASEIPTATVGEALSWPLHKQKHSTTTRSQADGSSVGVANADSQYDMDTCGNCLPKRHRPAARTFRRLMPHMRSRKQRTIAIPRGLWLGQGPPPRIPYIPVEDPAEGLEYMMCTFCNCDRIYRQIEGFLGHLTASNCRRGHEELLRLQSRADLRAGGAPMLLEAGQTQRQGIEDDRSRTAPRATSSQSVTALLQPHLSGQLLPPASPILGRWRRAADALLEATNFPATAAPPPPPGVELRTPVEAEGFGQRPQTIAERKADLLRELERCCPVWYYELRSRVRGLLGRTEGELIRLVAEARSWPETNTDKCRQGMSRKRIACLADMRERKQAKTAGRVSWSRELIRGAERDAVFSLAACRSEFLTRENKVTRKIAESKRNVMQQAEMGQEIVEVD
eukprot:TRINITY_DN8838_c1_g1_i1.p1 TRINITY_DN8838_c1_g1~~TRINITY_DN8838_c1_g1_i1.p1  ORF type:complete len:566 (+),score=55.77 TRINITY_DN8838_c1_g1_i1:181-1878(+)